MSLTSMLKGKREIDIELQTILRDVIPTKKQFFTLSGAEAFSSNTSSIVPYNLSNPYHSSVVGTAFDYMARFIVSQYISSNKENVTEGLTAKHGLEIIKGYCDQKTSKSLVTKFNKGINLVKRFVYESDMSYEELLSCASYMARLEHIYRSGMPPKDIKGSLFGREEKEIIADLKHLCEVFIERFMILEVITPENNVVFNPHFGFASMRCGGADADIYIDGTLYDFKTSKKSGYNWKEIAQICGYYILNCIAVGLRDNTAKLYGFEIKRLAFYRARYGEIEFIDISTMETDKMDLTVSKIKDLLSIPSEELSVRTRTERYSREGQKVKTNIFKKIISMLGLKV
ncbi:hypothetical protein [Neobacillus cucumis]|uniref:hypothetical protein n=1 Tax=Neobacillus cucumis TaxID=1740721 RepID=UPI002E230233|nr:hypothetical protein [Neobacillus cucumis]